MKTQRWTLATTLAVAGLLMPQPSIAQRGGQSARGFPGFGGGRGRIASPGSQQNASVPVAPAPAPQPPPGISTPPTGFPGQPSRPPRTPGVGNVVYPGTPGSRGHGNIVSPGTPGRNRQGSILSPGLPPVGPIPPLGPNSLPPAGTIGAASSALSPYSPGRSRSVYSGYPGLVAVPVGYSVYVDNQQYNDAYVEQPSGYEPRSSAQYDVQVYGEEQTAEPPKSTIYEVRPVYDEATGEARSVENVPVEPAGNRIQEVEPETEFRSAEQAAAGPVQHLIALDDGLIYLAADHWLEGDTLHYITLSDAHNMATLDRIDLELTVRLNRERGLKFQLRKREGER